MEPGDLIRWRGLIWLVRKVDLELSTAVVEAERNMEVIPSDSDITGECQVWCKPAQTWPSARLPYRAGSRRLVAVSRAGTRLRRFEDWVKLDDFQIGGALYLNPILPLGFGDRLTAIFTGPNSNFVTAPIDIPRNYRRPAEERRVLTVAPSIVFEPDSEPKTTPKLFARLRKKEG